jgi:hypothetical protein
MQLESILLPLAVGAIAGVTLAKKPSIPDTQDQLDKMKAGASVAGPMIVGASLAIVGAGILSLSHPKLGAGIVGAGAALGIMGSLQKPAGDPSRVLGLTMGVLGGGIAGLMAFGKPGAQFGASEVVIGYGGLVATSTLVFITDVSRLPAKVANPTLTSPSPSTAA